MSYNRNKISDKQKKSNRFLDTLYEYDRLRKWIKLYQLRRTFKKYPIATASILNEIIDFWIEIESSCMLYFINFAPREDRLVITTEQPCESVIEIVKGSIVYINISNKFGSGQEIDTLVSDSHGINADTDIEIHVLRKITKLLYTKTYDIVKQY